MGKVLYKREEIEKMTASLADIVKKLVGGSEAVIIPIAKGGLFFGVDLFRYLPENYEFDIVGWKSYSGETQGVFKQTAEPTTYLKGKKIILVDDIYDTGNTVERTITWLKNIHGVLAEDITVVCLLEKAITRTFKCSSFLVTGFSIKEGDWVYGYGLDLDGASRGLMEIRKKG